MKFLLIAVAMMFSTSALSAVEVETVNYKFTVSCYTPQSLGVELVQKYGEKPVFVGSVNKSLVVTGGVMPSLTLFLNESTGSYTLITEYTLSNGDRISCFLTDGKVLTSF